MNKPTDETKPKTARVEVKTNALRIGDFRYAAGHIIEALPLEEAEVRAKAGDIEIISVNPG